MQFVLILLKYYIDSFLFLILIIYKSPNIPTDQNHLIRKVTLVYYYLRQDFHFRILSILGDARLSSGTDG